MSHTYERTVGTRRVSITVNSDWSGYARIFAVELVGGTETDDYGQAVVDAQALVLGSIEKFSLESGKFRDEDMALLAALAAHECLRARAILMAEML